MVAVAQLVESRIVIPVVVAGIPGTIPADPRVRCRIGDSVKPTNAGAAQFEVRARPWVSVGRAEFQRGCARRSGADDSVRRAPNSRNAFLIEWKQQLERAQIVRQGHTHLDNAWAGQQFRECLEGLWFTQQKQIDPARAGRLDQAGQVSFPFLNAGRVSVSKPTTCSCSKSFRARSNSVAFY